MLLFLRDNQWFSNELSWSVVLALDNSYLNLNVEGDLLGADCEAKTPAEKKEEEQGDQQRQQLFKMWVSSFIIP